MKKMLLSALALTFSLPLVSYADSNGDSVEFSRPTFMVSQEVSRVMKGGYFTKTSGGGLNKDWMLPTNGSIDFIVKKNDRLGLEVMLSGWYFAAAYHYDQPQNYVRNNAFTAPRLDASYIFGDVSKPFLKVDLGIFGYKYDDYARNLGEYMFRTWAYPGIIQTGSAYAYLGISTPVVTGLKLSQSLGNFSHDFIASIETELTPIYDLNLTYMAKYNFDNVFKIGGGVQLQRVYDADKNAAMTIHYFSHNGTSYVYGPQTDAYYKALQQGIIDQLAKPGKSVADSLRLVSELNQDTLALAVWDSVNTTDSAGNPLLNVAMKPITASAIKPVVYFSFDPKPLFDSHIFGSKDLVLYGEAALLGVKDYPVFYSSMMRRIPVMAGFNIPTFKLLDVLSVEAEYYSSRWLPTYPKTTALNAAPTPTMSTLTSYYPTDWDRDNFKWSVSAERSLTKGVVLSGQVASDHSRSWDWDEFGKTPWEIYTRPSQWYWGGKISVKI